MVYNNRNSYPPAQNDFRDQRDAWGPPPRDDRDAGMGYGGAVWQSYNDGQDYRNESYNQRGVEPFNQRQEPFGPRQDYRDGGFRQDQSQASGFDGYGNRHDMRDDYRGGGYGDESRGFDNEYRNYDDRQDAGPPQPPERPARRSLMPGEKPDPIKDLLYEMQGSTYNLQVAQSEPKKFTARCRLFVAPLPPSVNDEELKKWFSQYGEVGEVFLNKSKNFAFVKMDTRENCEVAKNSLDFAKKDGVTIRVRFSSNPAAVRVSNLTNYVTNELLETAFSVFGEIERAVVIADERGRPTGEGIVEFAQKRSAVLAIRRCEEECLLLTASPRPVLVEPYDFRDEDEGLPERNLNKSKSYHAERELGPRTAMPGSFEYEFGLKWKRLFEMEAKKKEQLDYDNKRCRQMMEEQLDYYMYEHEANLLREKLRAMEEQTQQIQRERDMRMRAEEVERRRREDDDFRRRPMDPMDGGRRPMMDVMDGRRPPPGPPMDSMEGGRRPPMGGQGGGPPFQGQRGGWQLTGPPQVPPPYQSSRQNQQMGQHRF